MSWKNLIFANQDGEGDAEKKEEKVTPASTEKTEFPKTTTTSFPKEERKTAPIKKFQFNEGENPFAVFDSTSREEVEPTPTETFLTPADNHNPHLADVIKGYEKGFDGMNREGVDFYEFYKSIIIDDHIDNLSLYPMAFNMMKGLNPSFTKESAIEDSKYYLENLKAAHIKLKNKGEANKNTLLDEKSSEKSELSGEVDSLESQIFNLKSQLEDKKRQLTQIDGKYNTALNDVTLKLEANDVAKNALVSSINKVVANITKTIK